MEEPIATPKGPATEFPSGLNKQSQGQPLSSSPGFGTPAYPIASRPAKINQHFAAPPNTNINPSVLPILLPPQTLRPVAFRTLTKKHNLTLTSSGLGLLSTFVGRFCGSGWREDGLAERVLDEIAKLWKRTGGGVLVEDGPDRKLTGILKSLEPCMSGGRLDIGRLSRTNSSVGSLSRQNSLDLRPVPSREDSQTSSGLSGLDVQDDWEGQYDVDQLSKQDARSYMRIISALNQPRLMYSTTKKALEHISTPPSLMPPISHRIAMFRNRYNLVHQRLMRNESFQTPSFSISRGPPSLRKSASNAATAQQAYKITPISNLLGRSGSSHLLLGMLVHVATGDLALTDLSGSVALDLSVARPVPEDGAWFCPGMIMLVEGIYEEDGSNNSNLGGAGGVGGQIKGKFIGETIAGPPAERRDVTLGIESGSGPESTSTRTGGAFGWVDFLGVGSEKAMGGRMRYIQRKLLGRRHHSEEEEEEEEEVPKRTKVVVVGECCLDNPRTLDSLRAILADYDASGEVGDRPLAVVLTGNFVSAASCAGSTKGGGSVEYKEYFDALASTLSEFPILLAHCTFTFVPGDLDPWPSAFSAGASVAVPRDGIPDIFTSRIRRAVAAANTEAGTKDGEGAGEAIWATNPVRISFFGPVDEMVIFRDDITGRMRRNAITFSRPTTGEEGGGGDETAGNGSAAAEEPSMIPPPPTNLTPSGQGDQGAESIHLDDHDKEIEEAASHLPRPTTSKSPSGLDTDTAAARKLVKTMLDQAHLSPFPLHTRPVFWDFDSALSLYPLPTALVLADAEAPAFCLTYEGCHVMNPGRVVDESGGGSGGGGGGRRKGMARWIEYDVQTRKGSVRETRF